MVLGWNALSGAHTRRRELSSAVRLSLWKFDDGPLWGRKRTGALGPLPTLSGQCQQDARAKDRKRAGSTFPDTMALESVLLASLQWERPRMFRVEQRLVRNCGRLHELKKARFYLLSS